MKTKAQFKVKITEKDCLNFASISGDKNQIHINKKYALKTKYKKPILHGAFLSGLMSRMAGMEIPGTHSLVHSSNIKFKKPIFVPAEILVKAQLSSPNLVNVNFFDNKSGVLYAEGDYTFSTFNTLVKKSKNLKKKKTKQKKIKHSKIFVTGSSGDLGTIVQKKLSNSIGVTYKNNIKYHDQIKKYTSKAGINAIVHCGWPKPDNQKILSNNSNTSKLIKHFINDQLEEIINLSKLMKRYGKKQSTLVLIGSTYSKPGRHAYNYPYYSLGKNLLHSLTDILSLELGLVNMCCVLLEFDTIDGGMSNLSNQRTLQMAADRTPTGKLPTMHDVAEQIKWVLTNKSNLVNGSKIILSGGSLP